MKMDQETIDRSTAVIALAGNISSDAESILNTGIQEARRTQIEHVIVDFTAADHLDDAGVSSLVKAVITARKYGTKLSTYAVSERYRELFRLTGLDEVLPPFESNIRAEKTSEQGRQDDSGWAPRFDRIRIREDHGAALAKNMNGRQVQGPLRGFGYLWQKTYQLDIHSPGVKPADVIAAVKQHFPEFQPPYNRFFPTAKGITPGEYVLIDSKTPGGIVSTGVVVMYADDTGFSFIAPAGHPEAGWVSFRAVDTGDHIEMTIRGLASASDPLYELAFRIAGSKMQETIWSTVLENLARYLGVSPDVRLNKILIDGTCHWNRFWNIRYNAQLRTLPYNVTRLPTWK